MKKLAYADFSAEGDISGAADIAGVGVSSIHLRDRCDFVAVLTEKYDATLLTHTSFAKFHQPRPFLEHNIRAFIAVVIG